jgi:hypothetical protein
VVPWKKKSSIKFKFVTFDILCNEAEKGLNYWDKKSINNE